jgi:protein CpxP
MMTQYRNRLLISIAAFGFAAGAYAMPGGHGPGRMSAQAQGNHEAGMQERIAKRRNELHDKLKLTAGQESAWTAFVERMKPARHMARPDRAAIEAASAPERMQMRLDRMKEHEKLMAGRLAAVRQFYGILSADQQKAFNAEFGRGRQHRRS